MPLVTPYCTSAEADSYLSNIDEWIDLDKSEKDNALFWGRVYIDSNYRCVKFDELSAPDEIKFANALLAKDYIDGTLISSGGKINGAVKVKRVKAASVEVETEYFSSNTTSHQTDVDFLLHEYCNKKGRVSFINRV